MSSLPERLRMSDQVFFALVHGLVGGILAVIAFGAGKMDERTRPRPRGGCCHGHGGDGAALRPDPSPPGQAQPVPAHTVN